MEPIVIETIPTTSIIVESRQREDYGDIATFAESLKTLGLIQPIVINQDNRLVTGGRRLAAAKYLGWETVRIVRIETLSEDVLQEMELEENVQRKQLDWQEEVKAIAKIHALKRRNAALAGESWGQRHTGALLKLPLGSVNNALTVAEHLNANDEQVKACENLTEALRLLIRRAEDKLQAELSRRTFSKLQPAPSVPMFTGTPEIDVVEEVPFPEATEQSVIPLSKMAILGNCLDVLAAMPDNYVDHVLTDPPYGIDMDMLEQDNQGMDVSTTAREHDVAENIVLLLRVIPELVRVTKPNAFIVMWCDTMYFRLLHDTFLCHGLAVQRWPVVWCKTTPCMNNAAQYNTTKTTEIAIIARKRGATLASQASHSHVLFGNHKDPSDHPFEKPWTVWDWLLERISIKGQTILDPFAGRFSCPLACIIGYRNPIGIELVPEHYHAGVNKLRARYELTHRNVRFV